MLRVTEVLDYMTEPELLAWMLRTPKAKREKKSQDSLAIGTAVDQAIQNDLGLLPPLTLSPILPELREAFENCMGAWEKFKYRRPDVVSQFKVIQPELVYEGITGHPDVVCETADRWGIVDVKTSRTMYPKYWVQTAQYSEMKKRLDHMTKPRFIGILRLDKETGEPHYLEITSEEAIAYEVGVFQNYLGVYEHAFKNREIVRLQLEEEVLG